MEESITDIVSMLRVGNCLGWWNGPNHINTVTPLEQFPVEFLNVNGGPGESPQNHAGYRETMASKVEVC